MTKQKELYHCFSRSILCCSSGKEIDSKEYSPPTFNQVADKQHQTYYHNLKVTEVAYSRIDNNVDGMICLPEKCKKGCFTMLVEDNIDRNEETLTGTHFLLQKIAGLDIKKLLNYITVSDYYINLLFDFYLK